MVPFHARSLAATAALAIGLLAAPFTAAHSGAASSTAGGQTNQTITVAMVSDINYLDPNLAGSYYDRVVMNNITDKLFDLSPKGKIVPMLATGYAISKDRKTYTLTLRKGVKFQDGTAFNAAAVKFNLDRYRQTTSARYPEVKDIVSVTTPNQYTVKLHLDAPFSPLLSILTDRSGMMMSPAAIQSEGASFTNHPVGTGPFMFDSRIKGDSITLMRNPHYWRKGYPKAAKLIFKIFTDPNVELVNLQSGSVDFMDDVTSQNVSTVRGNKKLVYSNKAGYGFGGFWLNTLSTPFNNRYVREALSLLIDRKQFVKVTAGKTAIAANSPFGPGELAYGPWDRPPARNVKLARADIAKSGLSPTELTFTYKTTTAPISVQQAQIIQNMIQPGGFNMKIQTEDFPSILADGSKHDFQAAAVGWSGRPDPDQNIASWVAAGATYNYGQYNNARINAWMAQARRSVVNSKRKALYGKIATQLNRDQPYIFLDHASYSMAYIKTLHGFTAYPDGIIRAVGMYRGK